jgi:hypothetical protein
MNPRVIQVNPSENYRLKLHFSNGEIKLFDVSPYLSMGVFSELQNEEMFKTVKAFNGTVVWENELDFCPDTLYLESAEM